MLRHRPTFRATVSNNTVTDDNTDDSANSTPEESTAGDSNILVAYFSWSGNTQQIANNVDEAESAVDEWLTDLGYNN